MSGDASVSKWWWSSRASLRVSRELQHEQSRELRTSLEAEATKRGQTQRDEGKQE